MFKNNNQNDDVNQRHMSSDNDIHNKFKNNINPTSFSNSNKIVNQKPANKNANSISIKSESIYTENNGNNSRNNFQYQDQPNNGGDEDEQNNENDEDDDDENDDESEVDSEDEDDPSMQPTSIFEYEQPANPESQQISFIDNSLNKINLLQQRNDFSSSKLPNQSSNVLMLNNSNFKSETSENYNESEIKNLPTNSMQNSFAIPVKKKRGRKPKSTTSLPIEKFKIVLTNNGTSKSGNENSYEISKISNAADLAPGDHQKKLIKKEQSVLNKKEAPAVTSAPTHNKKSSNKKSKTKIKSENSSSSSSNESSISGSSSSAGNGGSSSSSSGSESSDSSDNEHENIAYAGYSLPAASSSYKVLKGNMTDSFKKKSSLSSRSSSTSADDDDPKDIDYTDVEKINRRKQHHKHAASNNLFSQLKQMPNANSMLNNSNVNLIDSNTGNSSLLLAQSQHKIKIKNTKSPSNQKLYKTAKKDGSIRKRKTSGDAYDGLSSSKLGMNPEFYLNRSNSINSSINSTIENTINNNLNDIVIGANAASGNSTAETYLIDRYNYAVRHIKQGLSVEEACNKYRISKGALLKCLSGGTAPRGKKTRLTETEENEIVEWLISDKDLKYNDAIHLVFEKVVTIFKEAQRPNPFNNGRPSMDWWYDFLSRHPQIMASKPDWLMRGKVNDQYIKDVQSGQLKCTKFRRALLSAIQYIQTLNDAESTNSLNAIAAAAASSNKTQKISTSTSSAKSAKQESLGAHRLASDNNNNNNNSKLKTNSLPKTANSSSSSGNSSSFPSNLVKPNTTSGGTRASKTLNDELLAEKKKRRNTLNSMSSSSQSSFPNANHSANKSYKSSSSSAGQTSLTINSTGMLNNSMATNSSSNNNNESIRLNLINNTNFSNSSSNGNSIHHDPVNNLNIEFNDEDLSSVPSFSLISSSNNNKLSRTAHSNTNTNNNQFYLTDNKCQSRHFFNDLDVNNNNNNNNSYFNQRSQASNGLSGLNVCDNNEENTNEDENEFDSEFLNATLNVDDNQLSELIDPSGIADDHDEYDNDEDINIDGLSSLANPHLNSALNNFYSFNKPNHVGQQHHPSQNLNNMSIKSNNHQSGILSHQNSDGYHLSMSLNAPHGMSHPKNSYYPHHHTLNKQQNHLLVPDDDDENDDENNDNNSNNNNNTSIVNNDEDDAYMGETIDPSAFLP